MIIGRELKFNLCLSLFIEKKIRYSSFSDYDFCNSLTEFQILFKVSNISAYNLLQTSVIQIPGTTYSRTEQNFSETVSVLQIMIS